MSKIGDRVRVIKNYDFAKVGMVGTIKTQGVCHDVYGVEFDTAFQGGHDCKGHAKNGHGQWVEQKYLELINPKTEKIVITHDGKTTLARLYEDNKVVKSAEAKCEPRDEFNFATGAKIAFERLTGEEKKEPPKFDKSMLTNGRFGYMEYIGWFVVVGDHLVYKDGGWDLVKTFDENGKGCCYSIKYIVESEAFNYAKDDGRVIWCAPDFDPKKVE
jgi:hypothetical protein